MHNKLLRLRQVEEITGLSRSSIYRRMKAGEFPRRVKIGSTAVRWNEGEIVAWLESLPRAE